MGYLTKVGAFNVDTTKTGGQTQTISGIGFQGKIVILWWSGSHETVETLAGGSYYLGFGAAISDASRFCISGGSLDAEDTSSTGRYQYSNSCIRMRDSVGLEAGAADFNSFNADGFVLDIITQFTIDARINYLVLGGDDLTNVYIGNALFPNATGNFSNSDPGFLPDALIIGTMTYATDNSSAGSLAFSLGMATGASNQGVIAINSRNAQVAADTYGYGYSGEVVQETASGASAGRCSFVSFDANGFTLNETELSAANRYYYICLKGGHYLVGDLNTRTDGNDIVETVGFPPIAMLFASANRALSTLGALTANSRVSIGGATSASARGVQAISDEDGVDPTETAYANYDSEVYLHIVDDALDASMDVKSVESDGFTCVMDNTETGACWAMYLAIGEEGGCTVETITETNTVVADVITVVVMEE